MLKNILECLFYVLVIKQTFKENPEVKIYLFIYSFIFCRSPRTFHEKIFSCVCNSFIRFLWESQTQWVFEHFVNYTAPYDTYRKVVAEVPSWLVYRVYLKYLDKPQDCLPASKTKKRVHINRYLFLRGRAQQPVDIRALDFYLWGHLKPQGIQI